MAAEIRGNPKTDRACDMRFILRRFAWALVLSVLGNPPSARADAADDQFAVAAGHYRQQRWQEACDELGKLLAAHADHPRANQARFFYGEALAQLGRWEQAQNQFGELLRRDPEHRYARQALFRSGETAYLGGDQQAAKRDLQTFHERFPQDDLNGYALPYLASLELKSESPAGAQKLFSAAIEQFPTGPLLADCHLGLAQAHEQMGQLDQARREYQLVADGKTPLSDQAMLHLGMTENALGDHQAALATFERLATAFPDSPLQAEGRLGRGFALFKLGRYGEAEDVLESLLENPSLRVEAHYWLGLSQRAREAWPAAAKTLLAGGRFDEQHRLNPALGYHAADALLRDGQLEAASDEFDRVASRWPQSPWGDDCLLGKLQIAEKRHAYADCVRWADELTTKFPDSPLAAQAELAKGQSLSALAKYAEAVDPLAHVLNRKTSLPEKLADDDRALARSTLALCYAHLGRFAEAQQSLTDLRAENARDELVAESSYQMAELAYAAGDMQRASELFSALAKSEKASKVTCGSLSGLAWCHFKAGEWSEAAAVCERLANQYPDSPLVADAAFLRGRALEHLEQLDAALAMYHVVFERYAASGRAAEALWRAAWLHDKLQQPAAAIELYGTLISEHPDFSELDAAIYRRAWLLLESGQATAADPLFERLRRDFPQSHFTADATLRLAERAVATEKYDDAEKLLTEITQPTTPAATRRHALYLQGRARVATGQSAAAEGPLVQLIEDFPKSELALPAAYLLAEACYQQGHYEQAARRLSELSEKTKDHAESWSAMAELRRAQALAQLKEWSEALPIAEAIAARFPNFDQQYEVDYLIGRSSASSGDFAAAREAYAKVIASPQGKTTQTAAMAQWMIGESYFHQENYSAALAEYRKVDKRYPFPRWQSAALLQEGKCQELLGQWRSAGEVYEQLLKDYPTSEFSQEAASRSAAAQQRVAGGSPKPK